MKKPVKKPAKFNYQISTSYLRSVYSVEQYTHMLPAAIKKIKDWQVKYPFDAIAFTGTSGAALAYPLSFALQLPLICIRKKNDGNHFNSDIEGCINARKYLIVDDFISSGSTVRNIIKTVSDKLKSKPVGIFLYTESAQTRRTQIDGVPIFKLINS